MSFWQLYRWAWFSSFIISLGDGDNSDAWDFNLPISCTMSMFIHHLWFTCILLQSRQCSRASLQTFMYWINSLFHTPLPPSVHSEETLNSCPHPDHLHQLTPLLRRNGANPTCHKYQEMLAPFSSSAATTKTAFIPSEDHKCISDYHKFFSTFSFLQTAILLVTSCGTPCKRSLTFRHPLVSQLW